MNACLALLLHIDLNMILYKTAQAVAYEIETAKLTNSPWLAEVKFEGSDEFRTSDGDSMI